MATYFVDNANGNDGSDGLSEGNAWATIDKAMNTVAAGDKVWVQGGTDYTETATIDTVGAGNNWIVFEGYTTSTGDGGSFTIDGGSTRANGITSVLTPTTHYRFENMILENHTGNGFNTTSSDVLVFVNCEANSNGARGFELNNCSVFVSCKANSNTTDGFGGDISCTFINCEAFSNTQNGFEVDVGGIILYNCIAFSNALSGISGKGNAFTVAVMFNCTVDGDSKDSDNGWASSSGQLPVCLVNNILYDCTDGIDGNANGDDASRIGFNNLVNSNTNAHNNWGPTGDDVTGAPAFTDEGANDYTLGSGSAAIDAGSDHSGTSSPSMDIGAHQKAGAAGGAQRWVGGVPFTW